MGYKYYGVTPQEEYSIGGIQSVDWVIGNRVDRFYVFQLWGIVFGVFYHHILPYIHQRMLIYRDYPSAMEFL
jgi:hypothetical protein